MLPCCRDCCGRKKKNDDEGNIYSESRRNTTRDHDNLIMHHHLSDGLPVAKYESLEYDDCFNTPYKKLVFSWTPGFRTAHAFVTWVLMFVIGFLTAMIGLGIDVGVDHLMDWKFDTSEDSVDNRTHDGKLALSLLTMMAFNVAFVFVATFLTTFEPYAAGSGIPEVKCYLNGVKMPNITRLKTLVVKAIGVLFSVAGGLFVGREGPMIHSGAVVAAGIPQFMLPQECYEKNEKCAKCKNKGYRHFRSDRMKRDFVSAGAAAGVAAAFGAPIGGVLFSLEEGSSFWKQDLTWKSLLCALSSTAVLNFFLNGIDYGNWASINNPELLHFGSFVCQEEGCTLWLLSDLFVFAIMGMLGGLLGAIFNQLNYYLTRYRILHVIPKGKVIRALEALLVAGVTTMVIFTASMTLGKCQLISNDKDASLVDIQKRFFCEDGYFNDMASLLFNGQESSIKSLFHSAGTFSLSTLSLCFFLLFFLACWTYGILVPSGLFVPSILVGAVYGRIWGELMHKLGIQEQLYPGSFALIGSAAFVGGVVRMTISLTVILIETTNEISYGLPIVVTLLAAKFVGDRFNIGLYDIHNEMKGVPFLEWSALAGMERLEARDVMETKLKCLLPHSTLNHVIKVLQDTKHNAFPVVTPNNVNQDHEESDALEKLPTGITSENLRFRRTAILNSSRSLRLSLAERKTNVFRERIPEATNDWTTQNSRETTDAMQGKDRYNEIQNNPAEFMSNVRFHGIILRSHLIAMLKNKVWYNPDSGPESQKEMDYWQMIDDYPRDPPIEKLELENADGSYLMDLSPYMKSSPYSVAPNMVVPKVFNFFRTMGLRHLPVINNIGEIVGIITRCDLTNEALVHSLRKRDFVSAGAAAGVAAAFGAPIGGVLFSLEEGSSFWNQDLTWKSLACAMTSTAVLNFFMSGIDYGDWKSFDNPGLLNFGSFVCQEDGCTLWSVPDLFIFVLMGMLGGLLGAIFNQLNYYLTRYRILHVIPKGKVIRALEALLVAGVTTMVTFTASMTLGKCQSVGNETDPSLDDIQKTFFCDEGYFNDMATLFFNGQESSIKALFHTTDEFSLSSLVIFFFIFFFLACWTYGILVPSGLFVPCILCGAAYGRIWGHILEDWNFDSTLYPGSFALIGSAAFVGGVVRMTISLTVILIETTNEITYGLPIMLTLLAAKFVGDLFNIGLYDIHNEMKGIPFLEWNAPEGMEKLEARDIMESRLQCLLPHSTVNHVIRLLRDTTHNAFPVVTPDNVRQDKEELDVLDQLPTGIAGENLRFRRTSIMNSMGITRVSVADKNRASASPNTSKDGAEFTTLPGTADTVQINERYNEIQSNPAEFMTKVRFHGIILRSHLIAMLKNNVWYNPDAGHESQKELDHWQMIEDYPRYPPIEKLDLDNVDGSNLMDLSPYMKSSPYSIAPHLVVPKAFNFFRTMGLRHLPVVNSIGEIVGIITRSDLTHEALLHKLAEKASNISSSPH